MVLRKDLFAFSVRGGGGVAGVGAVSLGREVDAGIWAGIWVVEGVEGELRGSFFNGSFEGTSLGSAFREELAGGAGGGKGVVGCMALEVSGCRTRRSCAGGSTLGARFQMPSSFPAVLAKCAS